jgi:hypothetical protein
MANLTYVHIFRTEYGEGFQFILNESLYFRTAARSSSTRKAPDEKHRPACGLEAQGGAVPTRWLSFSVPEAF